MKVIKNQGANDGRLFLKPNVKQAHLTSKIYFELASLWIMFIFLSNPLGQIHANKSSDTLFYMSWTAGTLSRI